MFYIRESCHHRITNAFIADCILPLTPFNPNCMATQILGRNDVLGIRIANDKNLRTRYIKGTYAKSEYRRIRLSHPYHSRLYYLLEENVHTGITQNSADIAIKV